MTNSLTVKGTQWSGDIKINPSIINQVSLYPNYLDCIREYIANAWDADADRVEITITDKEMIWEDWGLGIQDISQFWEIATPMKKGIEVTPKFHRQPIGAKGIGAKDHRTAARSSSTGEL